MTERTRLLLTVLVFVAVAVFTAWPLNIWPLGFILACAAAVAMHKYTPHAHEKIAKTVENVKANTTVLMPKQEPTQVLAEPKQEPARVASRRPEVFTTEGEAPQGVSQKVRAGFDAFAAKLQEKPAEPPRSPNSPFTTAELSEERVAALEKQQTEIYALLAELVRRQAQARPGSNAQQESLANAAGFMEEASKRTPAVNVPNITPVSSVPVYAGEAAESTKPLPGLTLEDKVKGAWAAGMDERTIAKRLNLLVSDVRDIVRQ